MGSAGIVVGMGGEQGRDGGRVGERESNEGRRRSGSVEGCGAEGSSQDARKYPSDKER